MTPYQKLEKKFDRLLTLRDAEMMLHWDASTMMPSGGTAARSEQIAALKTVQHEILSAAETADDLDAASAENGLDQWQTANLREMRHIWTHANALDDGLVTALSKASMACETTWRTARPESDFDGILTQLDEVLRLVRESAQAKAGVLDCSPYDALLDEFTPGLRAADIDKVFGVLEEFLPEFLFHVLDHQKTKPKPNLPLGPFPSNNQRVLGIKLMETLGFDFNQGRLDVSLHPFSGGTPDDLRITTRYDETDFTTGLMGILHETGHALYDMGLPKKWRCQPVGEPRGMDIHESQSLLIEMQACRSREFIDYVTPLMREAFLAPTLMETFDCHGPEDDPHWNADNIYCHYINVRPGLIRVDADEVTYPAHIILRTKLERALIADDLSLRELPLAWSDGMWELLGLRPNDHSDGCLQDIHWFDGAWGYFPSYTLGAITAAQLFDAALKSDSSILPAIGEGNFKPLYEWLGKNIHQHGSLYETPELIEKATGTCLDPQIFIRHLKQRYLQ